MSEVREGYKMTELGEIPSEWEVLSTEEIVINEKNSIKIGPFGSQLKKEYLVSEGYKVYGQENVFVNDFTLGNRFVDEERFNQLKSCELFPNDFVITMMGTIGKCAVIPSTIEKGIMDSHLLRLRLNENVYINDLLLHVIKSDIVQEQIKKLSVGGIMAGLSSKVVRQLKLPVPSIEEQQKIASILSTVDEQIDETEQLIVKTKELKKGLMQQLLTKGIGHTEFKQTELGEIPVKWEVTLFKNLCERIIVGIASSTTEYYTSSEFGVPIIRNQNIKENFLDSSDVLYITKEFDEINRKKRLKQGDLLTVRTGYPGITCVVTKDFENVQSFTTLISTPKKEIIDSNYLAYYMNSPLGKIQLANLSAGGAQQNLNVASLSNYVVSLPPLDEQQKIAQILSTVDEQIEVYEQEKAKYEELKKGLMQQLLTGQIRVKI